MNFCKIEGEEDGLAKGRLEIGGWKSARHLLGTKRRAFNRGWPLKKAIQNRGTTLPSQRERSSEDSALVLSSNLFFTMLPFSNYSFLFRRVAGNDPIRNSSKMKEISS